MVLAADLLSAVGTGMTLPASANRAREAGAYGT
jgi:hypothetical protein